MTRYSIIFALVVSIICGFQFLLGAQNVVAPVALKSDSTAVVMPDSTALLDAPEELDEVVIVTKKPIIEATGEKVGYNVEEDASASTSTLLEMLRKVPMVSVDGQDNVSINGKSDFKIYVNGKEDPMMSRNASTILKAMPASMVKKIEVILQPGAKYDAEGTGGILNLITEGSKKMANGSLTTFTLSASNRNISPNMYGRVKANKVTMSLNALYSNARINDMKSDGEVKRMYFAGPVAEMRQATEQTMRNQFLNGSFMLSWDASEHDLFNAGVSGYGAWGMNGFFTDTRNLDREASILSSNKQNLDSRWTWSSLTANASWQHTFANPGRMIVAGYQYVHGWNTTRTWQTYSDPFNFTPEAPFILNKDANPTNEHTLQVDYTHPFSSAWKIETGAKAIFRRNFGHGSTWSGDDRNSLVQQEGNDVNMRQYQNVAAIYATATASYGKWTAQGGARYEFTHMGVDFFTPGYDDFSSNLNDIVPNAAVTFMMAPGKSLRLNYQMRIRRPGVNELNPHENLLLTDYIMKGNPDLTSEKTHQTTLTYSNFGGRVGGNVSLEYDRSNNQISNYTYLRQEALISTYANTGAMQSVGFNGYAMWKPTNTLTLSLNASATYIDYTFRDLDMSNHGWCGQVGANVMYTLPWSLDMTCYGGWSSKRPTLQGDHTGWDYHGLSLSRKFLKNKKLTVAITATNFLHPKVKFCNTIYDKDYTFTMKFRANTLRIGGSIAYTFGSLKEDVKKTANAIVNDDVKSSSKETTR